MSGILRVSQLFGGNPAAEAYSTGDGYRVLGHTGVDFACPLGTPVFPCWDGAVRIVDSGKHGFGLHATITDARGRQALYGHLSAVDVHDGAQVRMHTPFARSGASGFATGPHVHFEVRDAEQDPANGYYGCHDPLGDFDHDVVPMFDLSLTNL